MDRRIHEIIETEIRMRSEHPVLYWVVQAVLFVEQPGRWLRVWWGRNRIP